MMKNGRWIMNVLEYVVSLIICDLCVCVRVFLFSILLEEAQWSKSFVPFDIWNCLLHLCISKQNQLIRLNAWFCLTFGLIFPFPCSIQIRQNFADSFVPVAFSLSFALSLSSFSPSLSRCYSFASRCSVLRSIGFVCFPFRISHAISVWIGGGGLSA